MQLTRDHLVYLRAAKYMEPFDDACQATDWTALEHLPLFRVANRMNAYNTYLLLGHEAGLLSRRRLLVGLGAVCVSGAGHAAPAVLPSPVSLPDELAQALKKGEPLLVMVSLEGCPHCKVVRESYLAPLRAQQGLAVVQIDMRNRRTVQDFNGATPTQDELIRSWGVKVAPTVLFFGRGGAEVAERLVGGYIPDFYGVYLDDRLRLARAAVRA